MAVSPGGFDARGFFEVAVALSQQYAEDERYRRTAVSRAYYACFHLAKQGLERSGRWSAGMTNAHERVLAELANRRKYDQRTNLRDLRRLREQADYALDGLFGPELGERALRIATSLMRLLTTF